MKFSAFILSAMVALPAWACIWDTDCPPGDKCVNGICKFKPPGGRKPKQTDAKISVSSKESTAAAAVEPISQDAIDKLATEYFVNERPVNGFMRLLNTADPHRCDDQQQENGPSCVDVACGFVGKFNCDEMSEVDRVGKACRGNNDGSCVNSTCNRLGKFNCDEISEIERVATMCRGNHSGKCIDAACGYLGTFNCDEMSEVERVNNSCRGVKASCIDSVCQKLGKFNCDEISEIEKVANSCRGN